MDNITFRRFECKCGNGPEVGSDVLPNALVTDLVSVDPIRVIWHTKDLCCDPRDFYSLRPLPEQ